MKSIDATHSLHLSHWERSTAEGGRVRGYALSRVRGPLTPNPPSLRFGGRVRKPAIALATAGNPLPNAERELAADTATLQTNNHAIGRKQ